MGTSAVAVAGAILSLVAWQRLRRGDHRRPEEPGVPGRWLVAYLPVSVAAVTAVFSAQRHDTMWHGIVHAVATWAIVTMATIDLDVLRLPDRWTGPTALFAAAGVVLLGVVDRDGASVVRALLAGAALGAFYLASVLLAPRGGMGLGDAKLAPSLGLLLGYAGWAHLVVGSLLAFVLAAVVGVVLMIARRAKRSTEIPFGPFMAAGAIVVWTLPLLSR